MSSSTNLVCDRAHAFLWGHSYKKLKLAQLLGRLGVFFTWYEMIVMPRPWLSCRRAAASGAHVGGIGLPDLGGLARVRGVPLAPARHHERAA